MNQNEETWPQIIRHVWNIGARALRVVPRLNTGSDYVDLAGDSSGNLNVNIGAASISVGGGVQYTEGDTDATIVGTAAMWEDAADTLRAVSMAKPLPVQPGTGAQFAVLGTIPNGTTGTPDPVVIGGIAPSDGHIHTFSVHHTAGGLFPMLSLLIDAADHALDIKSSGEVYGLVGSTDDTKTNSHYLKTASDGTLVMPTLSAMVNGTITATVNGTVATVPAALVEAVYVHGSLAAANINGSGSTFAALATHSSTLRSMTIYNTTDQTLQISFDGTITHALLPEGSTESWQWYEDGLKESSNVYARSNNASAPTTGRAIANGMS